MTATIIVSLGVALSLVIISLGLAIRLARAQVVIEEDVPPPRVDPEREAEVALMSRLSDAVGRKYSTRQNIGE